MHEKESHEKEESFSVNTSQLVLIGLAALFLMGAFQTWQLANTLTQLNTVGAQAVTATVSGGASQAQASAPAGSSVQTPSNLTNLPDQVGGC